MSRKHLIIILIALFVLVGACILPVGSSQKVPQNSNPQPQTSTPQNPVNSTSQPELATQTPTFVGTGQSASQTTVQKSFPLAPNSQFDENSISSEETNDKSGYFTINSQAAIDSLVNFYSSELPKQGWTFRYFDANNSGGVTQYWKKDNTYLSLDFGFFGEGHLSIRCAYQRVDSTAAQTLPKDFPLPEQAELVEAQPTSWQIYVHQNYTDVTDFYTQKLSSLNWIITPSPGYGEGSCGGDDCGGVSPTYPAGVTPMPTSTLDTRQSNELKFTMPDGNEIQLKIIPHQDGTILYIDETLKNLNSAGLPEDLPIYPGAVPQIINPGTATFQIAADITAIKKYYEEQLKAAGWTPDGAPYESSGTYLLNWKKGGQSITISMITMDQNSSMLVIDCSSCRP